ncbi:VOC family protein [Cognatilysobacter terrigena]|uniref:VOC family protein n=1 Tax=Cognatilysobacter terrigena TaxID=2488749 RepID=UPI00105EF85B|nr:VOC family protein [Lysobacter terrigena]
MSHPLYLNLPVTDVARTKRFVEALGLDIDAKFSGEQAVCVPLNEGVQLMFLARPMFQSFTKKTAGDPMTSTQHFLTLSFDSREAVDEFHQRAVDAGAVTEHDAEDSGFMYQRAFNDPEGHQWGLFWMDASQMPPAA